MWAKSCPHWEQWLREVTKRKPKRTICNSNMAYCHKTFCLIKAKVIDNGIIKMGFIERVCKRYLKFLPLMFQKLSKIQKKFLLCIGIFESPKCDVNPQPNTRGIGPLVGRTSGNRRSVMHVLVEIFSITYNFSFICQYIFIWLISSGREIFPLLKYPDKFLIFEWTTKIWAQVRDWPL